MKLTTPIATGNTANIYLHEGDIVKVYLRESLETVKIEASNQAYARSLGLPVPAVIDVTEFEGRPALVMERSPGVAMRELLEEDPGHIAAYLAMSVEIQRLIQAETAPKLRPMSERLAEQIGSVGQLSGTEKLRLFSMLEDVGEETQLCHGDLHVQNLIVDGDKVEIIDWMDATRGNPILDSCRTYVIYSEVATDIAEGYLAEYCRQSGVGSEEVLRWVPVIAGARMAEGSG